MNHVKRIVKKKSFIAFASVLAIGGTIATTTMRAAPQETRYVLAAVEKGTLVKSIQASGQVSGENQVDVKPTVSGAITAVLVKAGDAVKTGQPLFMIDQRSAQKTVRDAAQNVNDAKLSLESAQLSYQKSIRQADTSSMLQAQNAVNQAQRALLDLQKGPDPIDIQLAQADLDLQIENTKLSSDGVTPEVVRTAYDNAVPTLKAVSQSLTDALADADKVLGVDQTSLNDAYENLLSVLDTSKLIQAKNDYLGAKIIVNQLKTTVDALSASGEKTEAIDAAITQEQDAIAGLDPLLKDVQDVLAGTLTSASFSQSSLDSLRSMIDTDRSTVSSKAATLLSASQAIEKSKSTYQTSLVSVKKAQATLDKLKAGASASELAAAEERLAEAQQKLNDLKKSTDAIDLAILENGLAQRRSALVSAQNRLNDARETLADYTVRAPFDGIAARVQGKRADQASPSAAVATLLTQSKVANVTLNEVDVAQVKVGQKSTLTFDAVPDVGITGSVASVDSIGTVSQGVVTYAVSIIFDTNDDRIKSGMSVSGAIVTDVKTDVLLVPNGAVKSAGNGSVVQTLPDVAKDVPLAPTGVTSKAGPQPKPIEVGLSNDSMTEVTSGLSEGDLVVTRTITPSATTAAATTNRATGGGNFGSVRVPGGLGGGTATFISR